MFTVTQLESSTNTSCKLFIAVWASCPCILVGFGTRVNSTYFCFGGKVILATLEAWGNPGWSQPREGVLEISRNALLATGTKAGWDLVSGHLSLQALPAPGGPSPQRGAERILSKTLWSTARPATGSPLRVLLARGLRLTLPAHTNEIMMSGYALPILDTLDSSQNKRAMKPNQ